MKLWAVGTLICGSLLVLAASATEPLRGEKQFRTHCARCHSIGCNQIGPRLEGVFGRRAGGVTDFKNYSPAMKASKVVWTEETMDAFLYDPEKVVPGTPMAAAVFVEKAKDRQDLVSYLRREDRRNDSCP